MRTTVWGSLLVASLFVAGYVAAVVLAPAYGQAPAGYPPAASSMIALRCDGPEGAEMLTLIDTHTRVLSVYHVDRASGKVSLKSVRNVYWDLQMEEFNGLSPTPRDIQSLLRQRP